MLTYEKLQTDSGLFDTLRAPVPGGWLVVVDADYGAGVTFFPDPNHEWDGSSVPPSAPAPQLITLPESTPAADPAVAEGALAGEATAGEATAADARPPFTPEQQG